MAKKEFNKKGWAFLITAMVMFAFTVLVAASANALTDTTRPTIVQVSPTNNEKSVATHDEVTIQFSEPMDAKTINRDTFIVMQRTTPADGSTSTYRSIDGTVTYNSLTETATFTPINKDSMSGNNPLQPSQQYGNVFTVTMTTGATDLAGNSLSQDYMWSFTTGTYQFNTGTTTSQLNQAANNGGTVGTTTPPPQQEVVAAPVTGVTAPVTGAQAGTASNFSWVLIVGGAILLLLLIALIFGFAVPARKTDSKTSISTAKPDPFGDVYPVQDIEGIGPEYKKGLQRMGVNNTKQLWEADAAKMVRVTGAPLVTVNSWQNMAELASVKDIGPQYAELLDRSGIHSVDQLRNSNPNEVLRLVRKKQDSLSVNIQGNTPGHALVENWIGQARDHKFSESKGQTT